jgi:glycosyltransferase 2 family protein
VIQLAPLRRALHIVAIAILTIVFLGFFLWNSNLRDVWHIIRSTSVPWFVGGLAINFMALILRTVRWRKLLDVEESPAFYPTFFANTVGYMLSTVLPIRAGDVARPALLSRRTTVRFSTALGTVLTERILDLYCLLLLFIYYVVRHWNSYAGSRAYTLIKSGAVAATGVIVALTLLVIGIVTFRERMRRVHAWVGRFVPSRFREPWMRFFDSFAQSLRMTRRPTTLLIVLSATIGVWFCLTAQFWFVLVANGHPLPFDASFFISGLSTLGMIIPTPGGVGGFHKACQLVLTTFYGFDIDGSVAVALLFHAVGTLPVVLTGLVLFAREGLRWKDVTHEASGE